MSLGKTIRNLFLAGTLAASPFFTKKAEAVPIIIGLEARVAYVEDSDNLLFNKIKVGDIITGYYSYDSDTPDSKPDYSSVGDYWFRGEVPYGFSLNAGGFNFRSDPYDNEFLVEICNNHGVIEVDNYLLRSYNNLPVYPGVFVEHISWQLDDDSGTVLNSDALPSMPPILEDWKYTWGLRMKGGTIPGNGCAGPGYSITSKVTSAYLIPEPSTIALLGLGTLALITGRRKNS